METESIIGKTRYVLERLAEDEIINASAVTVMVWRTFYRGVKFEEREDGMAVGHIYEMAEAPSIREIKNAMRRIEREKNSPPEPQEGCTIPWWMTN